MQGEISRAKHQLSPNRGRLLRPEAAGNSEAVGHRRAFIRTLGAAGVLAGAALAPPRKARAAGRVCGPAKAIPGGFLGGAFFPGEGIDDVLFHVFVPGAFGFPTTAEPSSVFDFNGVVAHSVMIGTGEGTEPDGTTKDLEFEADMRFMSGVYIDTEGQKCRGTFGFV